MMHSLKDLLPEALRRGRISQEVAVVKIVEAFNELIVKSLPPSRRQDIRAISYKDRVLFVVCKNNQAAHWLLTRQVNLISELSRMVPEVPLIKIKQKNQVVTYDF